MAEHVTQIVRQPGTTLADLDRLSALFDRYGTVNMIRHKDRRDAEAAFAFLVAAKARYPILQVRTHVCRHDEGLNDCASVLVTG